MTHQSIFHWKGLGTVKWWKLITSNFFYLPHQVGEAKYIVNWHERRRCIWSSKGGQLSTSLWPLFPSIFFSRPPPVFPPLLSTLLIEGVLKLKTYLANVYRSAQKNKGWNPFLTPFALLGPLRGILDLEGGAAVQAVSKCPRHR